MRVRRSQAGCRAPCPSRRLVLQRLPLQRVMAVEAGVERLSDPSILRTELAVIGRLRVHLVVSLSGRVPVVCVPVAAAGGGSVSSNGSGALVDTIHAEHCTNLFQPILLHHRALAEARRGCRGRGSLTIASTSSLAAGLHRPNLCRALLWAPTWGIRAQQNSFCVHNSLRTVSKR